MNQTKPEHLNLREAEFGANFPAAPFLVEHRLSQHPLFSLESLIALSKRLPAENVEYNAGNIEVDMHSKATPQTGLSVEETIRRIETCKSWMVLKNVGTDPQYAALLNECLDQIQRLTDRVEPGMAHRLGYIFISSPGSKTPYHNDPEHNFLLQIRGRKEIHIWDPMDRSVLSETEIEGRLSGKHRNLAYKDEYAAREKVFELTPGVGLHFPLRAPHWVQNGPEVSVSFSITFLTDEVMRSDVIYKANSMLRSAGLSPRAVGTSPLRDAAVFNGMRALWWGKRLIGRQ